MFITTSFSLGTAFADLYTFSMLCYHFIWLIYSDFPVDFVFDLLVVQESLDTFFGDESVQRFCSFSVGLPVLLLSFDIFLI